MIYFLYIVGLLFVIGFVVFLFTRIRKVFLVLATLPTILSLWFLWEFISQNYIFNESCNVSDGCMNETGMFLVYSLFFIVIAIIILLISMLFGKVIATQ